MGGRCSKYESSKSVIESWSAFLIFLKGKPCEVFQAPFDVRLPVKSKKNKDIDTVLQPDLCVICVESNLDEAGSIGAQTW